MRINENELYLEDIKYVSSLLLPWNKMKDKSILISGASGLVASFIIDVIMYKNKYENMNCKIYAVGRTEKKARNRFFYCWNDKNFNFISQDINLPFTFKVSEKVEFVLHLASNTHPIAYAKDPIGTITTNIIGTYNMLQFAYEHAAERVAFASSNEIYGENRGDVEKFDEEYCGYINCNTMRAGYPESKRCGESLCQAFINQKGLDVVIPRLTRSFGPTMLTSDTKAISQFIQRGVGKKDIVLKSEGTQYYSYTYVADAVSGFLTILLMGKCGEAYNISNEYSDIMLKDLAQMIADIAGTKVIFELPDALEKSGYSKATKARLENQKLVNIGWSAKYDMLSGLKRTIDIMRVI